MLYNLFLDDSRNPKDVKWIELPLVEWVVVRTYDQFVETIFRYDLPLRISFDHDLADEHYKEYTAAHDKSLSSFGKIRYTQFKEKTGYDCALWLANYCVSNNLPIPQYYMHTLNGVGRLNIFSALESARKVIGPKCQTCGKFISSAELHPCPFEADLNNDSTPKCNCCPECMHECAMDI